MQVAFASLHTFSAQTIASGVVPVYVSMQDGVTGIFETSNATIFENAANAGLTGSPWGIKFLANGTYIVKENYVVGGGTAGVQFEAAHTFTGGNTNSFFQAGRTGALIGDTWDAGELTKVHTFFEQWADATDGNPAPMYVNPYVQFASGSSLTVDVQTMVIYLGPYANGAI